VYHTSKKLVQTVIPAAVVNNGSVTCQVIDTKGFDYLEVSILLGATDIALTALKLQESDAKASATALTGGVDIAGTVFGTDANDTGSASTLPSATDDNKIFKFEIDLRGRKEFVLPVITVGNGTTGAFVAGLAELSRGAQVPTSASDKNAAQLMRV